MHDMFTTVAFNLIKKLEFASKLEPNPTPFDMWFSPGTDNSIHVLLPQFNNHVELFITVNFDHRVIVIEESTVNKQTGTPIYKSKDVYGSLDRFNLWLHIQYLLNARVVERWGL